MITSLSSLADQWQSTLNIRIAQYDGSSRIDQITATLTQAAQNLEFAGSSWELHTTVSPADGRGDAMDISVIATLLSGKPVHGTLALDVEIPQWSPDIYVLMPAAIYAGNRFECIPQKYPPMFDDVRNIGINTPPVINDIPRLSIDSTVRSRIQQLSGDTATPAIGLFDPNRRMSLLLLTPPFANNASTALEVEESDDRKSATLRVITPGVREEKRYHCFAMNRDSTDRAAALSPGQSLTLTARISTTPAVNVTALYDHLFECRKDCSGAVGQAYSIPFSAAFDIQQSKHLKYNWEPNPGYLACGTHENIYAHWQTGWVGGLMNSLPLLADGNPPAQDCARRSLDYAFSHIQAPTGLFYGIARHHEIYGDHFRRTDDRTFHLIRKSADALLFIMRHLYLLRDQNQEIKPLWRDGARRCADGMANLWQRHQQFGQFVNVETGDIIVGGSASGSTAIGGLALAGEFLEEPRFLNIARASARSYYQHFTCRGITNGGPGEIFSAPDSESAFGLLESFITLYDVTGESEWLVMAEDAARQAASWVQSYDYAFPPQSTFGRLKIRSSGSVFANVQNKHSAPGICTLSGVSLLRLYRATGNQRYLELLRDIASNLPQYLSREDRPIADESGKIMPPGFMNERVNTSDWLEPVGEIFYGSTWAEVSLMLTWMEVPGVYAQPDTNLAIAFDNIEIESCDAKGLLLSNPTPFDATVKVFVETATQMRQRLPQNFLSLKQRRIFIPAGGQSSMAW